MFAEGLIVVVADFALKTRLVTAFCFLGGGGERERRRDRDRDINRDGFPWPHARKKQFLLCVSETG